MLAQFARPSAMHPPKHPPIRIRGARQNNLKNLDLDIPTGELVVVTGVSGSGKSSLVFDTLYAEGQRRYVETFSAYARQFLDRMDRPQVDRIDGVPPAIAIDQTNPVRTSRSTVGTMTEINDHLKLLWARFAQAHCPQGHGPIKPSHAAGVCQDLLAKAAEAADPRLLICFPVAIPEAFSQEEVEAMLLSQGYTRTHGQSYEARGRRFIDVIQDRFRALQTDAGRLREAVEACFSRPEGRLIVHALLSEDQSVAWHWSNKQRCLTCDHSFSAVTPSHFSFNSPIGACETCRGFGRVIGIDWDLVIPDASKTLAQGAIKPWQTESFKACQLDLMKFAPLQAIDLHRPWQALSESAKQWVLDGDPQWRGDWKRQWYGAKRFFEWLESKAYKMHVRVLLSRYRAYTPCAACSGTRLKPEAGFWKLADKDLHTLMLEPLADVRTWFEDLADRLPSDEAAAQLRLEIQARLGYLCEVGLGYLTLDRQSRTLSGGEVQRINLTTALGTSLVNTLFVLDEPSIGLHPRDMDRIIGVMQRLRDAGNSLVVVEHDPAVMWAADRLLDLGPGPGERGGEILFWGKPEAIHQASSLTADYLLGRRQLVQGPRQGREVSEKTAKLIIEGARENNLKNISVSLPLQRLVCLTGVSGSGKSTLMQGILLPALLKAKGKTSEAPGEHDRLLGDDWIEDVVHVDQSPIGKTARSNPVSYVGAFEGVRKRFAALQASRERSYSAGTFSFNSGNGRCQTCSGSGFEHIEMQFLSDVYLRCPDCDGRRFRAEVLEVKERGKSVADVLAMTVAEALIFYERDPEIRSRLQPLVEVGLEYLSLGQPVPSLSGGEAQRLKLAGFLAQAAADARSPRRRMQAGRRAGTLFLFDEPTTGLHFDDIRKLLKAFRQLLDAGHSLLVIEHNLDVISACDWVIDLGPEAGDAGGHVVACDTPEGLSTHPQSHTGRALANYQMLREPQPGSFTATGDSAPRLQAKAAIESSNRLQAGEAIVVHHAREHNLKQLDVHIPRNQMTVITGPSGSGKSSLAFDVIFGEGQRRYLESLNAYARQFVQPAAKPDVEGLYGIPPTVAIEQRSSRGGQKSTVATLTEVYHFLRLLWMRLGTAHCPTCQIAIEPQTFDQLAARLMRDYHGRWIGLFAPLVSARKGIYKDLARWAVDKGYSHFRVDGHIVPLQPFPSLDRYQEHSIELPVSSLRIQSNKEAALREALQSCLELGKGTVLVLEDLQELVDASFFSRSQADIDAAFASRSSRLFSTRRACSQCGLSLPEPDPRLFSFNSKIGACQTCQGTGLYLSDAMRRQLGEQQQFGAQSEETLTRSETLIDQIETDHDCPDCDGERLNPIARAVRLSEKSLGQLSALSVTAAREWFTQLKLNARAQSIAHDVLTEVHSRLEFLERVGLGYLHLNRSAPSLSGGEAQRIRLAAQLGSNLQGVCYVLDEPTIGLHPRDNKILVDTLQALRDRGNTLLVVEHDEETIRRADYLIDIGPGAGRLGGSLMASGSPNHVLEHDTSLTAKFLREPLKHPMQPRRTVPEHHPCIEISKVRLHNLKAVNARIPLGRLTVITGVSGSGKSTLARDVLLRCAQEQLQQRSNNHSRSANASERRAQASEKRHVSRLASEPGGAAHKLPSRGIEIKGLEAIDRVLEVDQTPIGKTPRSCPATYVGFWDAIRRLFADTQEARIRGWDASRFSFNTGAGRCSVCEGQGQQTIEMNFLPDVKMLCEGCKGARFNPATLEVRWQGLTIGDVLAASVDEALGRFEAHPSIHRALKLLQDLGLGYLSLGQPSPSLSGGEAQRIKLVTELAKARGNDGPKTLYVLDEPTVGLHMADVEKLIRVFHRLVDAGHSLVVVEHDMDIWAEADWLIDLGPEGGDRGGEITMQAPPEELARHPSHTGRLLGAFLKERRPLP